MSKVYTIDHIYWALENGYGNVWAGMDGADIHQGFNPIQGDMEIPKPKYEQEMVTTSESLDYNVDLSYDKDLLPGKGPFPGGDGMIYRDPFLMQTAFTHKTVSGTWAGGAATYGKVTGDFSALDDLSSIMIQCGNTDGTTPINRCYNGILTTAYLLGFKKGGLLRESVELSVADFSDNTQAFVTDANFDNGRWSLWALKSAAVKKYPATACKIYWDNSHIAELAGLKIENCQFKISMPKEVESDYSTLRHEWEWNKNRAHEATISGILYGDTEFEEAEAAFSAKTKKDLRFSWDQTALEQKWLQIDDAWIQGRSIHKIPSRENAVKLEFTFKGKTSRYEGNFENITDPTPRIDIA